MDAGSSAKYAQHPASLSGFVPVFAERPTPRIAFQALSSSTVRIAGRATLGDWQCETNQIVAAVEPGPTLELLAAQISGRSMTDSNCTGPVRPATLPAEVAVPHANISIPVSSLQCDKPGMRADVLLALKSEDSPLIVIVLTAITDLQVQGRGACDLGRYRVLARGDLVLAGALRPIEIAADVVQETPRRFRIAASKDLRLSDFGITPPSALFGVIRADDRVTVFFNLNFEAVER